jgi:hypothetical protein
VIGVGGGVGRLDHVGGRIVEEIVSVAE